MFASITHKAIRTVVQQRAVTAASLLAAVVLTGAGSFALAQAPAVSPATQKASVVTTAAATSTASSVAPALNIRQVYDRVEAAGYREIREIELERGRFEIKAQDSQGVNVKLYVNAITGAVEHSERRHARH